jgi:UV DNA damage endonuclease
MKIRIGYCCINTLLPSPNRTCRLRNATPDSILDLARQNLAALGRILQWNLDHGILLFRISSETIPFGSHPINPQSWQGILQPELSAIGEFVKSNRMRVSMHPGQYTVLNSIREEVVSASLAELDYHAQFLEAIGQDFSSKIILHLGGTYGDKALSLQRFIANFRKLPERVQKRLVVENDEKNYTLSDALDVNDEIGVPVVFDVFHHSWNSSFPGESLTNLIHKAAATWKVQDGPPKVHYSNQWVGKPPGSHSKSIDLQAFAHFYTQVMDQRLDIMLEVKDKEQSVLAVHNRFPELRRPPSPRI